MKKRMKNLMSNDGMTLIEILLSIVILTIVVLSFSAMFIQSARTNQQSESIMDATYVAQEYMEEIINLSNGTFEEGVVQLKEKLGLARTSPSSNEFTGEREGYYIVININNATNGGKLIVKVYNDKSHMKLKAQMETILDWEG